MFGCFGLLINAKKKAQILQWNYARMFELDVYLLIHVVCAPLSC